MTAPAYRPGARRRPARGRTGSTTRTRPDPLPPLTGATTADLLVVGGGYTGLWTALLAKERRPRPRRASWSRPARCGWAASGRNGGFCAASLTHGLGNGLDRFPDEIADAGAARAARTSTPSSATVAATASTATSNAPASSPWPAEPYQVEELAERTRELPGVRPRRRAPRRATRPAPEVDSPTYLGGLCDPHGAAMRRPGPAGLGSAAGLPATLGVRIYEHTRVARPATSGAGHAVADAARGPVRAGRVALATNAFPPLLRRLRPTIVPVYDYVLMTEPLIGRAAGRDRLGAAGRASATPATSSTTTGSPPTTGSCGAATTPSTTSATGIARDLDQRAGDVRPARRALLHDLPAARGRCASPTAGAGSSTPAAGSRRSSAPPTAAGWPTPSGYTGLGVGATRFGADVMLDLLDGRGDRADPAARWCAASRCRSRPSRPLGRASSSPAGRMRRPTATRAAATSGCAPSTGSASASTPEAARGARPDSDDGTQARKTGQDR